MAVNERVEVWRWIDENPSYLVHVFLDRTMVDPLGRPLYENKRYLFLIARESEEFRMFVDFRESWIRIFSGGHRVLPSGAGTSQLVL